MTFPCGSVRIAFSWSGLGIRKSIECLEAESIFRETVRKGFTVEVDGYISEKYLLRQE